MEKILSGDDKIRRAEEIYYRRKMGIPNSRFSKTESEKKSYFGSKILLEVLLVINLSIIIMGVQNRDYIFTEDFLNDVQKYNINITKNIKEFVGIDVVEEIIEENTNSNELEIVEQEMQEETFTEEIVPNEEGQASSLSEMDEDINKIRELLSIEKPIKEGIVTSRFGTRESSNKNVEGYHTGIDIGAVKRNFNLCCNITEQLIWYLVLGSYR